VQLLGSPKQSTEVVDNLVEKDDADRELCAITYTFIYLPKNRAKYNRLIYLFFLTP
jgi:hypothetical protein